MNTKIKSLNECKQIRKLVDSGEKKTTELTKQN